MNDEYIQFIDEDELEVSDNISNVKPWLIGIIDDESSVHEVTKLALRSVTIEGRPLKFYSAFSGKGGFDLIQHNPDIVALFLDVVMETADAGLRLVEQIRNELDNKRIQIILRTGQPGYLALDEVINRYEINAYRTKTELTRSKLISTLTMAIKNVKEIKTNEETVRIPRQLY